MASTVARRSSAEELENRRRMVLELVKSSKSTTLKELADSVDTRPAAVAYDIRALQKDYPEIVHPKGSGKVYWTGVEEVKTFDRYPLTKNGEGYPDPTAAPTLMDDTTTEVIVEKAMENKTTVAAGDIWEVNCSKGGTEKYIVLGVDEEEGFATCIMLSRQPSNWKRLYTKPLKYFVKAIGFADKDEFNAMLTAISQHLGIQPVKEETETITVKFDTVAEPVEKESEPKKEEKGTDKLYSLIDLELVLARQRADIYQHVFETIYSEKGGK